MKHSRRHPLTVHRGKGKSDPPRPQVMDRLLNRCDIHLSPDQLGQLWTYHQLLRRYDSQLNLTRIRNFENMVVKLYADSILPARHYPDLPSPLLDLGTGPGMPGIPLAIFRPDLHILLADSRQQRTDFLKLVVNRLGLPGLEVVERGIAPDYGRPVAGVITRAVEPIGDTLVRVSGCIQPGGQVFFMKGPHCDEEIQSAQKIYPDAYRLTEDIAYQIPQSPHRRRLVIFQRTPAAFVSRGSTQVPCRQRVKIIESERNPLFKALIKLLGGRGVKKQGLTLVCGRRLVDEAIHRSPERCRAWISHGDRHAPPAGAPADTDWIQLSGELFTRLDLFGIKKPILLYDYRQPTIWRPGDAPTMGCNLLVPFQDPENVGAVIRTAAALEVNRIILLAESANPFHPKAVRASAGAVFSAPLHQGPSLAELPDDLPVIALATHGRPLAQTRFPKTFYLLTGMEGPGLPSHWQPDAVAIPMAIGVESLNAAVATAIALYEWRQRQNAV